MKSNFNVLYEKKYLISEELEGILAKSISYKFYDQDRLEDMGGIYLVKCNVLNKESNVLIYSYVYYQSSFALSLLFFLFTKRDFRNSLVYSEWGNFLTVINPNCNKEMSVDSNKLYLNESNLHLRELLGLEGNTIHEILTYSDFFYYINNLVYSANNEEMALLIDLGYHRKYKEFSEELFSNAKSFTLLNNKLFWDNIEENSTKDLDILGGSLFVTNDLLGLSKSITNRGYVFNQGPKRYRGEMNSMVNFLSLLDVDYRNSLYRHHQYHVSVGSISRTRLLNKSKFSYRNVHQNMGGVKWYNTISSRKNYVTVSSNTSINKNVEPLLISKTKSNKSMSKNSPIYSYLSQWLGNNPINETTQISLEKYLLNYTYISIDGEEGNPLIDYSLISPRLNRLLLDKKDTLIKIINNFRGINININKKRLNQKDKSQYYLNLLLKEIDNNNVIAIIYGRLMRIITRYNRFYSDEGALDILHDITDNFVRDYLFSLYSKHLYSLYKESTSPNKGNRDNFSHYKLKKMKEDKIWELRKTYTLSNWRKANSDLVNIFNDGTLKTFIGGLIIEWMIVSNLIESKTIMLSKKDKNTFYIPTEEVLDTLGSKTLVNLPFRIPMIVKPNLYHREITEGGLVERLGGYLLNDFKTNDSLIIPNWELKSSSTVKEDNVVYDLVNNMNSVGYKINKDVLGFIDKYGVDYDLIIHEESSLLNKSNLRKMEKIQLESYQNKMELQENILGLARVYSQIHEFYLPVRLDFRGRMYCISEYLNYQSTELAKSLLLFSKAEKIKKTDSVAISYLKAFGANCFGNKLDKKSWNERTKWIDDNIKDIISFENGKLIKQASNKLLFIAFCFEYNRWLSSLSNVDSAYFETYLPIQLDATCNGYQHLSLLSLDLSLAKELNLITSTWDDLPKDFYNYMSTNLIDMFKNKLSSSELSEEQREDYTRLSVLDIARAIVKKAIMTTPYNVSTYQMIKYIRENFELCDDEINKDLKDKWYQFIDDPTIKLKSRDFSTIGLGLKEVLNNNFFKLKGLMKYLKEIAKICASLNLPIPWGLPSGLLPVQSYLAVDEVRLKPFSYNKSKFIVKIPNKDKYNMKKQIRAFMPNLVHSLDAASLALLVDMYFNNSRGCTTKNIYSIHDCFAVTANNVENIVEFLKLVYIKIYSEGNYLKQLDEEIRHQIIVYYGKDAFINNDLIVKVEGLPKMKYPDINEVLGVNLPGTNLDTKVLKSSSYLIN